MEERLFVEVTGVVQVDALVVVDPYCEDNSIGVVRCKRWSRKFQFTLTFRHTSVNLRKKDKRNSL